MLKRNRHLDASVTRFEEVIPGFFLEIKRNHMNGFKN